MDSNMTNMKDKRRFNLWNHKDNSNTTKKVNNQALQPGLMYFLTEGQNIAQIQDQDYEAVLHSQTLAWIWSSPWISLQKKQKRENMLEDKKEKSYRMKPCSVNNDKIMARKYIEGEKTQRQLWRRITPNPSIGSPWPLFGSQFNQTARNKNKQSYLKTTRQVQTLTR